MAPHLLYTQAVLIGWLFLDFNHESAWGSWVNYP